MRGWIVVPAMVAAAVLAGCEDIPEDASEKAFCSAGRKYSELRDVKFSEAVEVSKQLADVGTPANIDASARAGFVELIDRMAEATSGSAFRKRTLAMTEQQRQHLLDLDTYIQKTCVRAGS